MLIQLPGEPREERLGEVRARAGEPEPVGAGCFWLLGAGAGAAKKLAGS